MTDKRLFLTRSFGTRFEFILNWLSLVLIIHCVLFSYILFFTDDLPHVKDSKIQARRSYALYFVISRLSYTSHLKEIQTVCFSIWFPVKRTLDGSDETTLLNERKIRQSCSVIFFSFSLSLSAHTHRLSGESRFSRAHRIVMKQCWCNTERERKKKRKRMNLFFSPATHRFLPCSFFRYTFHYAALKSSQLSQTRISFCSIVRASDAFWKVYADRRGDDNDDNVFTLRRLTFVRTIRIYFFCCRRV